MLKRNFAKYTERTELNLNVTFFRKWGMHLENRKNSDK